MSNLELLALVASIASLILAIGAIWLSIVFYKMSDTASKATIKAASDIDASVQKLEKLFDKLYSDTFSMVKDTVSDMRNHIWNGEDNVNSNKSSILKEAELKTENKIQKIKSDFDNRLNEILQKQEKSENKVIDLGNELENLLESAIQASSVVESETLEEMIRKKILEEIRQLEKVNTVVIADDIVQRLDRFISIRDVVSELRKMSTAGILKYEGNLQPDTVIEIA